jgi:hypothetical protein
VDYVSQSVGYGSAFADTVQAALKTRAAAALVATPKIRLSSNSNFNPTPQSSIATLSASEAAFSGYPAGGASGTVSDPVNLSTMAVGVLMSATFVATTAAPFVEGTCYGYWVDDGTNVIAYERFAGGIQVTFGVPGDFLQLDIELPMQLLQATV